MGGWGEDRQQPDSMLVQRAHAGGRREGLGWCIADLNLALGREPLPRGQQHAPQEAWTSNLDEVRSLVQFRDDVLAMDSAPPVDDDEHLGLLLAGGIILVLGILVGLAFGVPWGASL